MQVEADLRELLSCQGCVSFQVWMGYQLSCTWSLIQKVNKLRVVIGNKVVQANGRFGVVKGKKEGKLLSLRPYVLLNKTNITGCPIIEKMS